MFKSGLMQGDNVYMSGDSICILTRFALCAHVLGAPGRAGREYVIDF